MKAQHRTGIFDMYTSKTYLLDLAADGIEMVGKHSKILRGRLTQGQVVFSPSSG